MPDPLNVDTGCRLVGKYLDEASADVQSGHSGEVVRPRLVAEYVEYQPGMDRTIMATIPQTQQPAVETVEGRFRRLEAIWTSEVGHLSSYSAIVNHPAFREIVSMGEAVVPLMLADLEARPRLWVWALPEITGANPVAPGDAGKIAPMSEAWVRWGREQGYRW